jgi:hypothetical protein
MIVNNFFERPFYFATTVDEETEVGFNKYFRQEGIAYRVVPTVNSDPSFATYNVEMDRMYDRMMNRFDWNRETKLEVQDKRMITNYRIAFANLVGALLKAEKKDSAKLVLRKCETVFPDTIAYYGYFNSFMVEGYYKLGDKESAGVVSRKIINHCVDFLKGNKQKFMNEASLKTDHEAVYTLTHLLEFAKQYDDKSLVEELNGTLRKYQDKL